MPAISTDSAAVTGRLNLQLSEVPPPPKFVVDPNVISNSNSTASADCAYLQSIVAFPNDGVLAPVDVDHVGVHADHVSVMLASLDAVIRCPAAHGANAIRTSSYRAAYAGYASRTSAPADWDFVTPFTDRVTVNV